MSDETKKSLRCSFCGKREEEVRRMIQGPGARICDQCVNLCMSVLDEELGGYVCDVIVPAGLRGRGYGYQGLALVCQAAKDNGVPRLLDNIALDNPSVALFLKSGFREIGRNEEYVLVAKDF